MWYYLQTEILSPIASDKPIPRLEVPPNEDVDDTLKKIYETKNEKELSKYNVIECIKQCLLIKTFQIVIFKL